MIDERLKEQYNQSVVELKEALKRERIFIQDLPKYDCDNG